MYTNSLCFKQHSQTFFKLSIVVVVVLHFDLKSILKIDDKDGGIRPVGQTTDVAVSVFLRVTAVTDDRCGCFSIYYYS